MPQWFLFNSGLTALRAQSTAFDNISNNIANATTPGFKAGSVRFQDLVASKNNGGGIEQLSGVNAHQQVFIGKEGIITGTGRQLDGAIAGSGFFVTNTTADQTGAYELTDAGNFSEALVTVGGEERTYLTDIKGNFLLGYNADPTTGEITVDTSGVAALEPIDVTRESALLGANATTRMEIVGNIPPDTATGEEFEFDFTILDGTGDADNTGDERVVTLTFAKTATDNTWNMTIDGTGGTVTAPAAQPIPVVFDAQGRISTINGATGGTQAFTVDWTGPTASNSVTLDLTGFTQFAGPGAIDTVDIDGNVDGRLRDIFFGQKGQIIGSFSNGISRPIAQVALGDVVSPDRMNVVQGTHYTVSQNSGDLTLYDFATTTRATFQPAALEQSTVDFASEFSDLIITQRAYSSAATTVRTVDEMTQTATNLKN